MNESRQQLRNRLELLEDIRCWLLDRIDGSEETKGDDGLISDFIRKLDALSSEMGTIPSDPSATPITDAVVKMMEAGWLSLGSSAPGAVKPLVETMERMEREVIDLKQRLLPQFAGRTQKAEHERDALLEELIVRRTAIANLHGEINEMRKKLRAATTMPCAPSATEETAIGHARYEYLRTLNPRKFSALYNEALMGVYQFDDLVDRYRDAKELSK